MRWTALALALVVAVAGCGGEDEVAIEIPEGELILERLWPDGQPGAYDGAENLVIRDGKTWDQVWRKAVAGSAPLPAAPAVDFRNKMVLAAFLGPKEGSGHAVSVARVEREGDRLIVTVATRTPTSRISPGRTSPWSVVAVPRTDLEIEWRTVDAAGGKTQNR